MLDQPNIPIQVRIRRLPHCVALPLLGNEGLDLRAAVPADVPVVIARGQYALIPTGLVCALPPNIEGQVRPRPSLAARHGVTVLNAPGTIPADYRGEVGVLLVNLGSEPYTVERGAPIAQLVFAPTVQASIHEVSIEELSTTS
jgi:dUTP pyrophosphatase